MIHACDPVGLAGGSNTYAYVGARVLSASDPHGLWAFWSSLSDAEIAEMDGNPDKIREFVQDELGGAFGFDDRQDFYAWAHEQLNDKPGATQTDWFQDASNVNGFLSLGAVDIWAILTPLTGATEDFLIYAGEELAVLNVQTFIDLYLGRSPVDACIVGNELDLALVNLEQGSLSNIIDNYFAANPEEDRESIVADLNSVMNRDGWDAWLNLFPDSNPDEVIATLFPGGFDFSNESHRIMLGHALVRISNGMPWRDPALYEQ